jgi:hypothetical protein
MTKLIGSLILLVLLIPAVVTAQEEIDLTPPELGSFDPASVSDIDLSAYPVLPEVTDHARAIYAAGIASGVNPQVFSKVGDCMTANELFMAPFSAADYDLGAHDDLQTVIDYFSEAPARDAADWTLNSFANPGLATTSGFNTASVQDALWADPTWCSADESPLACEYRISNPAFSVIMFGTNDVFVLDEASFDYYLRNIVIETINRNIVPVISTFPERPEYPEKSMLYNQIIVKIAEDYDLPLINLWLGLEDLPNKGVDEVETTHLSIPPQESTGYFSPENLEFGYTYRNLVTLQALDLLVKELAGE